MDTGPGISSKQELPAAWDFFISLLTFLPFFFSFHFVLNKKSECSEERDNSTAKELLLDEEEEKN